MDILISKDTADASDKIKHALSPELFKSSDSNCAVEQYDIFLYEDAIRTMTDPVLEL